MTYIYIYIYIYIYLVRGELCGMMNTAGGSDDTTFAVTFRVEYQMIYLKPGIGLI